MNISSTDWLFQGERINTRDGSGFISSEDSLVIQSIRPSHQGQPLVLYVDTDVVFDIASPF
jgi:hypothetical protein